MPILRKIIGLKSTEKDLEPGKVAAMDGRMMSSPMSYLSDSQTGTPRLRLIGSVHYSFVVVEKALGLEERNLHWLQSLK